MNRKRTFGMNVGSSSILIIFVLLCLTTFATLSMVSANADYTLSRKALDASFLYYEADGRAEETLAAIDAALAQAEQETGDRASYFARSMELLSGVNGVGFSLPDDQSMTVRYEIPMGDSQELFVALSVQYPLGSQRYTLEEWRVVNTNQYDLEEENLNLWQGGADSFFDEVLAG